METMHAAGRRRLPPVPRRAGDRPSTAQLTVERPEAAEASVPEPAVPESSVTELIDTRQIAVELIAAELAVAEAPQEPAAAEDEALEAPAQDVAAGDDTAVIDLPSGADEAEPETEAETVLDGSVLDSAVLESMLLSGPVDEQDPAQQFVTRLRSSAADFADAAGAQSAVVREAVPPARHRRARCRLVLRYSDGTETDVTLLGPAGRPGRPSRHGFDRQILRWLGAGLVRDDAWLTRDPDAPDGIAVDLTAWVAAG